MLNDVDKVFPVLSVAVHLNCAGRHLEDACARGHVVEYVVAHRHGTHVGNTACYSLQSSAIHECVVADSGSVRRNVDPTQAGAVAEGCVANLEIIVALGQGEFGEAGASAEGVRVNISHALGNNGVFAAYQQISIGVDDGVAPIGRRIVVGVVLVDHDAFQAWAVGRYAPANRLDAGGNVQ